MESATVDLHQDIGDIKSIMHRKASGDVSYPYVMATITTSSGWYTHFSIFLGRRKAPVIDIRHVTVFLIKSGALFIIAEVGRRIYVKVID